MTTDVLIVPQVQFRRELGDLWRQTEGVVVTAYSHPWAFFHPIDRDNGGKLLAALRTVRRTDYKARQPSGLSTDLPWASAAFNVASRRALS